jgi:hypothetical protein
MTLYALAIATATLFEIFSLILISVTQNFMILLKSLLYSFRILPLSIFLYKEFKTESCWQNLTRSLPKSPFMNILKRTFFSVNWKRAWGRFLMRTCWILFWVVLKEFKKKNWGHSDKCSWVKVCHFGIFTASFISSLSLDTNVRILLNKFILFGH